MKRFELDFRKGFYYTFYVEIGHFIRAKKRAIDNAITDSASKVMVVLAL